MMFKEKSERNMLTLTLEDTLVYRTWKGGKDMYTVHEVAKLTHTTVKTLHHYHKIGLLIPEQTTEAGYRLYGKKRCRTTTANPFLQGTRFSSQRN